MKAAFYETTGGPEVIRFGELPAPAPKGNEVLVKVGAAALNPIDLYIRQGMVPMPLPKPLAEVILQAVPARARRAIEVELESGPAPSSREAQKAQRAVADVALQLLERGVIELQAEDAEDAEV